MSNKETAKRITEALDLINSCRVSVGDRVARYKTLSRLTETGSLDGAHSLINRMHGHLDRLAGHIYSPEEVKFSIGFESYYPKDILDRALVGARVLTSGWKSSNTDVLFGLGVQEALKYGSCFLKQYYYKANAEGKGKFRARLVMPWQMAVYREDESNLDNQPAFVESTFLTLPEVWPRIQHLPEAEALYRRIEQHAKQGANINEINPALHNLIIANQINTSGTLSARPTSGGVVNLEGPPMMPYVVPQVNVPVVLMHELWQWGGDDWVTTQIIEPDVLVTRYKKGNLLVSGDAATGLHPYTLIQPEEVYGNIWGRSSLVDLIDPQEMLTRFANDTMRLYGLQVDKILGFAGLEGDPAEAYDQLKAAGYVNLGIGGDIKDITPAFPAEALPMLRFLMEIIDLIGGFTPILGGQGDAGVRAGTHAETLLKTASPRLRDMALHVEKQCASAGELRFELMRLKDDNYYWTDGDKYEDTKFHLLDLPNDYQVNIDSHSSSAVFMDDHTQLVGFGVKSGIIDPISAVEMLPFNNKDMLIQRIKEKQAQQSKMVEELKQQDPEAYAKMMAKKK